MAPALGVTPGELLTFAIFVASNQQRPATPPPLPGGPGFPVIMNPPGPAGGGAAGI
jgi:hypothetical protein